MLIGLGTCNSSPTICSIASAITRQENTTPSYNNPGGLIAGAGQTGTAPNGIAIFSSPQAGEDALDTLIQKYVNKGSTITDLVGAWAPTGCGTMCAGNNPALYAANVSSWTGFDPNTPISQLDTNASSGSSDVGSSSDSSDSAASDNTPFIIAAAVVGVLGLLYVLR